MIEVEIMFGNKIFNIDIQQCTRKNFIVIFLKNLRHLYLLSYIIEGKKKYFAYKTHRHFTRALVEIIRLHPDKIACHLIDNIT